MGAERRRRTTRTRTRTRTNTTPQRQCVPVAWETEDAPGWLRNGDRSRDRARVVFAEALQIEQAGARIGLPALRTRPPSWKQASVTHTPGLRLSVRCPQAVATETCARWSRRRAEGDLIRLLVSFQGVGRDLGKNGHPESGRNLTVRLSEAEGTGNEGHARVGLSFPRTHPLFEQMRVPGAPRSREEREFPQVPCPSHARARSPTVLGTACPRGARAGHNPPPRRRRRQCPSASVILVQAPRAVCPRLHAWHCPFCRCVSNLPGALWHRPGSGVRWKTPCPPASSAGGFFTAGPPGREVPSRPSTIIYPETFQCRPPKSLDRPD